MFKYQPHWQGPLSGRSFEKQTEDFLNGIESRVEEIDTRQTPSDATPMPSGVGFAGTSEEYSRGDHSHPLQTDVSGNAGTANALSEAREISMSGEGSGSASFDGSTDISIPLEVSCIATGSTERRAIADRFAEVFSVEDFGAVGDGVTDDASAIQAALAAAADGRRVVFGFSKTYLVKSTLVVSGESVDMRSSIIVPAGDFTPAIRIRSGSSLCNGIVDLSQSTSASKIGVILEGTGIKLDGVRCTQDQETSASAFLVCYDSANVDNVEVKNCHTKNISCFARVNKANNIVFSNISVDTYVVGLLLRDVTYSAVHHAHIYGISSLLQGVAGENGILMEATSDFSIHDILIDDVCVEDSGEHGYRLGGSYSIRDVSYVNCSAYRSGSAGLVGTTTYGGCGFKCRGNPGHPHKSIMYQGCKVYDVINTNASLGNWSGYRIEESDGVLFLNCLLDKIALSTATPRYAISMGAVKNIRIFDCCFYNVRQCFVMEAGAGVQDVISKNCVHRGTGADGGSDTVLLSTTPTETNGGSNWLFDGLVSINATPVINVVNASATYPLNNVVVNVVVFNDQQNPSSTRPPLTSGSLAPGVYCNLVYSPLSSDVYGVYGQNGWKLVDLNTSENKIYNTNAYKTIATA